jgi:hypothetical protein
MFGLKGIYLLLKKNCKLCAHNCKTKYYPKYIDAKAASKATSKERVAKLLTKLNEVEKYLEPITVKAPENIVPISPVKKEKIPLT